MAKAIKMTVTPMWLEIKEIFQKYTNKSDKYGDNFPIDGELDKRCHEFIDLMGELTHQLGFECVIEDIHMNLWKERIWSLVENAGLLPEIAWRDDKEKDREEKETWYAENEDDYDYLDEEPTDLNSNKNINVFE